MKFINNIIPKIYKKFKSINIRQKKKKKNKKQKNHSVTLLVQIIACAHTHTVRRYKIIIYHRQPDLFDHKIMRNKLPWTWVQ